MATSIASQLQAIRSIVKADTNPVKRPFTRPSILFDAKEAADIDIDSLFNLALSGIYYSYYYMCVYFAAPKNMNLID